MPSKMLQRILLIVYTRCLIASYFVGTFALFLFIGHFHSGHLDELYQLRIGLEYCQGNYHYWNDEVTIFPGMFWASVVILRFLKFIDDPCSTVFLRMVNYIIGVCNIKLFGFIIEKICNRKGCYSEEYSRIYTLNHGMLPVLYVFTFIYYSEPLSVFTVFLMYYLYLNDQHTIAAFTGIIAIFVHQTNVVWVGFISMLQFMKSVMYDMRKWDNYRQVIDAGKHIPIIKIFVTHTIHLFVTRDELLIKFFIYSDYLYVCEAFFCILVFNKGIVIVDIVSQNCVIHIPQLLYFCLFYIIFSPCAVVLSIPKFLRCVLLAKKQTALVVAFIAIIIYCNTLVYPSLLDENWHYEFYVWKQLYEGNVIYRYLLIPLYMLGGYTIIEKLKDEKTPFIIAYMTAIVLLLVTQKRIEFRYYLLPYLFLTIHSSKRNVAEVIIEGIYYILINIFVVINLFTQETFWNQDMWR